MPADALVPRDLIVASEQDAGQVVWPGAAGLELAELAVPLHRQRRFADHDRPSRRLRCGFTSNFVLDHNRSSAPGARMPPGTGASAAVGPRYVRNLMRVSSPAENTDGLGNCHESAPGLMTDLILARATDRWHWVTGTAVPLGEHSWLERDGWAIDCADVAVKGLVFMERNAYRRHYQARDVVVRDAKATRRWVMRESGANRLAR
jgi:hypothetical protein